MLYILFIFYFCFSFTFNVYTNVLNTVVFMVRKRKKAIYNPKPSRLLKISVFSTPYYSNPSWLLVFGIFSNHLYCSTPQSIRDLTVGMILLHVQNGREPFKARGFSHTKKGCKCTWITDFKMFFLLESFPQFSRKLLSWNASNRKVL